MFPLSTYHDNPPKNAHLVLANLEAMLVQVAFLREGAVAAWTDVILSFRGVDEQVRAQIGLVGEGTLAADVRAAVRSFAGVRTHVALEQPRAREVLSADGALVLGSMVGRQYVRTERAEHSEDARAHATTMKLMSARVVGELVRLVLDQLGVGHRRAGRTARHRAAARSSGCRGDLSEPVLGSRSRLKKWSREILELTGHQGRANGG